MIYIKISVILKIFVFIIVNKTITSWSQQYLQKKGFFKECSRNKQHITTFKNNKIHCSSQVNLYINNNDFLKNKKLITISPGGFKGFYLFGITTYIKENYNTDNLIYSGASAGAWNALFMCYKGDPLKFVLNLLNSDIKKAKSINEVEYFMKYKILSKYTIDDFDLEKLFIGVTTFTNFLPQINIFSDFETLEDAINCCIASSHIPFITGGFTNKYHNMFTFDGGFSNYPYLDMERLIHITPSMWNVIDTQPTNTVKSFIKTVSEFGDFFSLSKNNLLELFDDGYHDAKKNKDYLDKLLQSKEVKEVEQVKDVEQIKDVEEVKEVEEENNIEF